MVYGSMDYGELRQGGGSGVVLDLMCFMQRLRLAEKLKHERC